MDFKDLINTQRSILCIVLSNVLKYILDTSVPLCRLRVKHTSALWNHSKEIISARCRRDGLHCPAMKSGDWSSYRCRNQLTTMTRSAKRQYLSNLVSDLRQDSVKFGNILSICLLNQEVRTELII